MTQRTGRPTPALPPTNRSSPVDPANNGAVLKAEAAEATASQGPKRRWRVPWFGAEAVDWNLSDAPAGDSPPLPRWPLYFWMGAWLLFMVFLIVMMVLRLRGPRL